MFCGYICLKRWNTTNNSQIQKKKLQHTLGEYKTSYGAWDRQAKANLKHHLRHLEWVERGIRPEIVQIAYEIPQFGPPGPDGVRPPINHPADYRIEALRGRQVKYLDPR